MPMQLFFAPSDRGSGVRAKPCFERKLIGDRGRGLAQTARVGKALSGFIASNPCFTRKMAMRSLGKTIPWANNTTLERALEELCGQGGLVATGWENENGSNGEGIRKKHGAAVETIFLDASKEGRARVERLVTGRAKSSSPMLMYHWEALRTRLLDRIDAELENAKRSHTKLSENQLTARLIKNLGFAFCLIKVRGISEALRLFEKRNARFLKIGRFGLKQNEELVHFADGSTIRRAKLGDLRALDSLVRATEHLVQKDVRVYWRVLEVLGIEPEDVLAEARDMGIRYAVDLYDPLRKGRGGRPPGFGTVLHTTVIAKVLRYISNNRLIRLPSHVVQTLVSISKAIEKLESEGRRASVEAIAGEAEIVADEIAELLRLRQERFVSLDAPLREDAEGNTIGDIIAAPEQEASRASGFERSFAAWAMADIDRRKRAGDQYFSERNIVIFRWHCGFLDPANKRDAAEIGRVAGKSAHHVVKIAQEGEKDDAYDRMGTVFNLSRERVRQLIRGIGWVLKHDYEVFEKSVARRGEGELSGAKPVPLVDYWR